MKIINKKLIGGNWKALANAENIKYIEEIKKKDCGNIEVFVAVPYIFIEECSKRFPGHIKLASQDISESEIGAHTGEIPAEFLKSFSVKYTLIGHSERRKEQKETDEIVNRKLKKALEHQIRPVLCIGDSKKDRDLGNYIDSVRKQFYNGCENVQDSFFDIAYEPEWSIGTGVTPTTEQVVEMVTEIKIWMEDKKIKGRCIYGGSVNLETVPEFSKIEILDGFLIGAGSIDSRFEEIISEYASELDK